MTEKIERLGAAKRAQEPERQVRYNVASRNRLSRIISKKLQTAFIGALYKFEQYFGREVWGHGKDDEELTESEELAYETWQQCRTEILNNGNNQIRALENELEQYDVKWLRNQVNVPVVSKEGVRNEEMR